MPTATEYNLMGALRVLNLSTAEGPLAKRLETVVDADLDAVLTAYAAELGGKGARSKASRDLMRRGARALLMERRKAERDLKGRGMDQGDAEA